MCSPLIHCCDSSSSPAGRFLDDYALSSLSGLHAYVCANPRAALHAALCPRQSLSWQILLQYHLFLHCEQRKGMSIITSQRSQVAFVSSMITLFFLALHARS